MSFLKNFLKKFFQDELDGLQNKVRAKDMLINKQNEEIQKERNERKKAEADKIKLRKEVSDLKNKNVELSERNNSILKDIEAERNKKDRNWKVVVSERESHADEIKNLNDKFYKEIAQIRSQKDGEIQSLKNEIESQKDKIQSGQREVESISIKLTESNNKNVELEVSLKQRELDVSSLESKIEKTKQELHLSNELISKLSKDNEHKEELINSKGQELNDLKNVLNKQNSNVIDLEKEKQTLINDYELEINRKEQLINNQNITLSYISKTKQKLEDIVSQKDSEIEELKIKASEVFEKMFSLEDEKERHLEELKSKEAEKIKLNQTIESIRKSNSDLKIDNENLSGQLIEKESVIKDKDDIISAQQSKIIDLEKELNKTKSDKMADPIVKAMRDEIVSKDEEIKELEKKIQTLNEIISDLRDENSKQISEINSLKSKNEELISRIDTLSNIYANSIEIEGKLNITLRENEQLKAQIEKLPKLLDLEVKEKEIRSLKEKIEKLENKLAKIDNNNSTIPQNNNEEEQIKDNEITTFKDNKLNQPSQVKASNNGIKAGSGKPIRQGRPVKLSTPYRKKINPVSQILEKKNFPPIENDNKYSITQRLIDHVFNIRTNKLVSADEIFLRSTAEEITYLTRELVKAKEKNIPYLVCPSCNQMVTIASRRCGWANNFKDVNYFTHAVKNIPCDLKKEPPYSSLDGDFIDNEEGNENIKVFRQLIGEALTTPLSKNMGVSEVNIGSFIYSEELPIMKRRLVDVTAKYNNLDIVFELVSETTGVRKVYDRDRFYLINNRQVFWIFGLEAVVDYNELRRTVAKDILFTNRRNVFVFDQEAQDESKKRGELILKCNWLDEDNEWFYRIEKNGKNGLLISLDQIKFDPEDCRPFYFDADKPYFNAHPTAARPVKPTREDLKNEILQQYEYEQARNKAYHEMETTGTGVSAFYDGDKWGFYYGDLILIEPTFTEEPKFESNLIRVKENDKYGVLNRFGEYLLKPEFEEIEILPNGTIIYSDGRDWKIYGLIGNLSSYNQTDYTETWVDPAFDNIYYFLIHKNIYKNQPPQEFYFIGDNIFIKDPVTAKWSLWYSNGAKWTDNSFDSFEITPEGKIKVIIGGKTQLLTINGEIIEEQNYKTITPLAEGYNLVETLDKTYYIADNNKNKLTDEYLKIEKISDEYLKFHRDGKWGLVKSSGEIISKAKYSSISEFNGERFIVQIEDSTQKGIFSILKMDNYGNLLFDSIERVEDGSEIIESLNYFGVKVIEEIKIPLI
ncbi:MAG: WG repeat-containing protein [Muribaculaceae bacterium]|nr:WG repeat-containing protein [Muribaculaceae bacterium]